MHIIENVINNSVQPVVQRNPYIAEIEDYKNDNRQCQDKIQNSRPSVFPQKHHIVPYKEQIYGKNNGKCAYLYRQRNQVRVKLNGKDNINKQKRNAQNKNTDYTYKI